MPEKPHTIKEVPRVVIPSAAVAAAGLGNLDVECFWECQVGMACLSAVDIAAGSIVARFD